MEADLWVFEAREQQGRYVVNCWNDEAARLRGGVPADLRLVQLSRISNRPQLRLLGGPSDPKHSRSSDVASLFENCVLRGIESSVQSLLMSW